MNAMDENKLMETLLELTSSTSRVEQTVNDMNYKLFGNGQPGIIKEYEGRLDELKHEHGKMKAIITFIVLTGPPLFYLIERFGYLLRR